MSGGVRDAALVQVRTGVGVSIQRGAGNVKGVLGQVHGDVGGGGQGQEAGEEENSRQAGRLPYKRRNAAVQRPRLGTSRSTGRCGPHGPRAAGGEW